MNKYLFVSDIHGRDTKLEEDLTKIALGDEVPKIVFFLGDILGTKSLDQLQKLFYNGVVNPTRKFLEKKPSATDIEILSHRISDDNDKTIADGGQEIWSFLFGDSNISAKDNIEYILELIEYQHFGHFCSNLPEPIRNDLKRDLEENAAVWIQIMNMFVERGTTVVIVEGNWDARNPLDFLPIKNAVKPTPIEDRDFCFKKFLKSKNSQILYFDQVGTIETENEIFVLWPFDSAVEATMVPEFEDEETRKIILVSHAQIDWKSINGDKPMTAEGRKIQDNMPMTFKDVKANTAVHGHLHTDIDSDG